ncbi:VOC family protein [Chelativorans sp.]|uniref:VOC family protein n=1 Tax=Chelativorans sp. TaxID=2203393 RepID=UPI002810D3E7|nr:VOC family protein [Chelativorans sp.]
MFSHIVVGADELDISKKFYDAIFTASGGNAGEFDAKGRVVYTRDGVRFMVTKPINGQPATFANGGTVGFSMQNAEQVQAWHDAGVVNGGTSVESPPGLRDMGARKLYLAYLRDPIGNKLCARAVIAG